MHGLRYVVPLVTVGLEQSQEYQVLLTRPEVVRLRQQWCTLLLGGHLFSGLCHLLL